MKFIRTERGFGLLNHETYPAESLVALHGEECRLAQHSSVIRMEYCDEDGFPKPGTSYLWIGEAHHLNRQEVAEFVKHLQSWLDTGSLELTDSDTQAPAGEGEAS